MNTSTPGPWATVVNQQGVTVRDPVQGFVIAEVRHPGKVLTNNRTEQLANAQLMAAAPLMLEALTALLSRYSDEKYGPSVVPYFIPRNHDDDILSDWRLASDAVLAARARPGA